MKLLLPLILLSSLLAAAYSAVFFERQITIPGFENGCYDREDDVFYKKGEEMNWKLKICGRKICRGPNGKGSVYAEIQTCGKVKGPPECHTEVNLELSYPHCCEKIVCPEEADVAINIT